jgi:deoxyribose-phosphate aldolase
MTYSLNFTIDTVDEQIQSIVNSPLVNFPNENDALLFALNTLDLTTLEGNDTSETIFNLCTKAKGFKSMGLPNVAAVCVYPVFVKQALEMLHNFDINVACVAGAFPSGQSPLHVKLVEVQYAVDEGAEEIDMVISRGKFLEGIYDVVFQEVAAIKAACQNVHLKVILETGELVTLDNIYKASMIAMEAGADFIKTSTGKISPAATPEASYVMLKAIGDFYKSSGKKVGFKAAGGIVTPQQALVYVRLVEEILGSSWLTNKLFRIGASRLAKNIVDHLQA